MEFNESIELTALLKKWKTVLLFAIIGLVISYCYASFFEKPSYSCSRSYFINNNTAYTNDLASRSSSMNDITVARGLVETYKQYMANPNVLLGFSVYLKDHYGYDFSYQRLGSYIKVCPAGETELINVVVTTGDKKLSSDISAAVDEYLIPGASNTMGYSEIKSTEGLPVEADIVARPLKSGFYGAIIGAVLGAAFVFALYIFNNKITDEEEFAKKCAIPVLGNIPELLAVSKGKFEK